MSSKENALPPRSFLRPEFWKDCYLPIHADKKHARRICNYIEDGVPIGYQGNQCSVSCDNWPSSIKYKSEINDFIEEGLRLGRIEGPHESLPPNFKVSPLGAFKRHRSNKVRPIHDLSWPPGLSTNDGIDSSEYSMSYMTIDDVIRFAQMYDDPWATKIDIRGAYLFVKVRPEDRHLLGFKWQRPNHDTEYFNHASLPFGLSSACYLFNEIADSLQEVMIHRGAPPTTTHYLDDFISVSNGHQAGVKTHTIMEGTADDAGFETHKSGPKNVVSAKVFDCIGYIVDFNLMQIRISEDRMQEIREILAEWKTKQTASKREILSIIGKLQFCAKVIRDGSKFLRRLIELSKKPRLLHHRVTMSREAIADLAWWDACLESHNGIYAIPRPWSVDNTHIVFSDASDIAAGIVCYSAWSIFTFDGQYLWMRKKSIAWRELFAVVLLMCTFGPRLQNSHVTMFIDNMSMVQCVNSGKSKEVAIMGLIRALYYYTSLYCINYKAIHLSSASNAIADSLSRMQFDRFRNLHPLADSTMTLPIKCIIDF